MSLKEQKLGLYILSDVTCQALVEEAGGRIKVTFNLLLIHDIQLEDLASLAMMGC